MAERIVQVAVDQWGHTPGFAKGTTVLINDDDPKEMTYSVDGNPPLPFVGDLDWGIRSGSIVEIDGDSRQGVNPIGRLPTGDNAAIDRGAPSDPDFVPVPSGSAEDGPLTMAPNPHPEDAPTSDASGEELTPAQKAARTRAANAASTSAPE